MSDNAKVCTNCKAHGHDYCDCTVDGHGWDEAWMIEVGTKDARIKELEKRVRLLAEGRQRQWERAQRAEDERDEARRIAEEWRDAAYDGRLLPPKRYFPWEVK